MMPILKLLRCRQWLKNLMIYFPPFLGGTFSSGSVLYFLLPFAAFCCASSAAYSFNDIVDREHDRHHPDKRSRPIACGSVSVATATGVSIILLICSVSLAWQVSIKFLFLMFAYLIVSFAYSSKLKDFVLVDIFSISACFLLRLEAGGAAFSVHISEWLFLSVFLLSVFLSAGKRLAEKQRLNEGAYKHRKALTAYPDGFLDGMMYISGSAVLVTYTMYVISRHSQLLVYSVPLCCFGLFRYIIRVQSGKGGDPTESLTRDIPLLLVGFVWVVMVGWGIYGR